MTRPFSIQTSPKIPESRPIEVAKRTPSKGLSDSIQVEAERIPKLKLRIGRADVVLREIPILAERLPSQYPRSDGNAGRDLIGQARSVTLDFRAG